MSNAVTISGSTCRILGTVRNRVDDKGIAGLSVAVYDKDPVGGDDFLGTATTDGEGQFLVTCDTSAFSQLGVDKNPDLYFIVRDDDQEILKTEDNVIEDADGSTPPIILWVNDFDSNAPGAGKVPALGWVGGFAQSNPAFAYPDPDLTSLPMLGNLVNIDKLERQQKVLWPEFSWETAPGQADSRCFQMFAPDISRLGYTSEGRVYSIICPQQGVNSSSLGCLNVEVTVGGRDGDSTGLRESGNRGWVDENTKALAADLTVEPKIWFSPSAKQNVIVRGIWEKFAHSELPFPSDKAHAVRLHTYKPGEPDQPIFPLRSGETTEFTSPGFARHPEAWNVANLGVEIGSPVKTGVEKVDDFNQLVMDIINAASGNMLAKGNVLTWNVWFIAPQHVDRTEWATHAEKWRESIQADHGSPEGSGTEARYFDGRPFKPFPALVKQTEAKVLKFVRDLF